MTKQITGGSLAVVGFAAAIFQIFKSIIQIPVARVLDKTKSQNDDFYSMLFGSLIVGIVPFLYIFATESYHVYIIQAIYGIGAGFSIPPWFAIFSKHLDKLHENIEWSMESIGIGISGAVAAAVGGILAQKFGFNFVFIIGGIVAVFGALQQIRIFDDIKKKIGRVKPVPDRGPET
ncbi:MAG: hypothetical protein UW43_C0002G0075 [Candidatus Yanofskybacteria bacterium GW2011_GWA1_44_21]|uniref:Major facilitator superfamily (MFS) profile domain-containing protein n=1 Tax=Candidatus Wolfebacteria bacterium GW2011_GWB1_41_12 TaxID=1619006 RepID=A0A0G0UIP6_9BACT|nr:MAG: hypothetical protein UU38_C0004G0015 [Candidatus Wolfebacteria bacterium GW2011_GWB1_41_12]KKT28905.1 MAG: hypothetical protein UW14_C0001G0016 [Candidatus Yanofskybacteria bacterium GW2011_GWA2_44_10]KKT50791.1 MAG: hypothetical protein UW43_C0002G0075 [Candidatus Yanofskybacteria bacterium GW2011_GWA1_44_21]